MLFRSCSNKHGSGAGIIPKRQAQQPGRSSTNAKTNTKPGTGALKHSRTGTPGERERVNTESPLSLAHGAKSGSLSHPLSWWRLSESFRLNVLLQNRHMCCCCRCVLSTCRFLSCCRPNDLLHRSQKNRSCGGDDVDAGGIDATTTPAAPADEDDGEEEDGDMDEEEDAPWGYAW